MPGMLRATLSCILCASLHAAVTRVELVERTDYANGREFPKVGIYEQIRAKAYFEVDPNLPQNKIIVDLGLAARNARGMVEFSADVVVLKPTDTSRGNGTILFEVSNRGGRGAFNQFHRATDQFLMEQGFTVAWCGWQWDIPSQNVEGLRLYPPVATDNGKPIRGPVRAEWVPPARATKMWLGDRNHVAYPVVEGGKLTMRLTGDGERREIPASAWKLADQGQAIEMAAGFEPGKIYEFVYTSENPRVAGLGPAAIRDFVTFLKNGGSQTDLLAEERRYLKRVIGFGTSQSGRFLRKFLYDGFNADEKGRKVFDAVWAHVAGAGRGSFNHRFAQASRDGHAMMNFFYPTDLAPFGDDAILRKSRESNVVPRVFYTDGSYEYWGRESALTTVTPDGSRDVALPAEVRRFYLTGTQHGAGQFPPRKTPGTEFPANSNDYRFAMRALLLGLNRWITIDRQPPQSAYPTLAAGDLVSFDKVQFPVAGVKAPSSPHRTHLLDFGPEFESSGIVTKEPPEVGKAFPVLVPQLGPDGNERGGIRLPQIAIPLAAYTGWNYRTADIGSAGQLFDMVGATFPFPKSRIAEIYKGKEDYLARTLAAARALVKQGYLLEEDLMEIMDRAAAQWGALAQ